MGGVEFDKTNDEQRQPLREGGRLVEHPLSYGDEAPEGVMLMQRTVAPGTAIKVEVVDSAPGVPQWEGHWCDCCSHAGGKGCWVCCLTCWCPCISFAWNQFRLHGNMCHAVLWGIFYSVFIVLPLIILCLANSMEYECSIEDGERTCDFHWSFRIAPCVIFIFLIMLAIGLFVVVYKRAQMRKRYNIRGANCGFADGNTCDDCLVWSGSLCLSSYLHSLALCQETRTLAYNNVKDGMWFGPDKMRYQPSYATTYGYQKQEAGPTV